MKASLLVSACLLSMAVATWLRAQSTKPQNAISGKEVKWLIQNGKTAADHQKLAAYYRTKAEHLMGASREHQEMAEAYANRTVFEPKVNFSGGLLEHCREFAALEAKAAQQAQEMAAIHDEMAKKSPN